MYGMLDKIKTSMRISHNALDEDIYSNMDAALIDMVRVGIQPYLLEDNNPVIKEDSKILKDELVRKAIEYYVKWNFDYQEKAERWEKAYNSLRDALSLSGEYKA